MDVWVSKAHSFRRKTLQKTTRFALLYTKNTTSKNFTVKRLLSTLCSVITRRTIPKLLQFGSNYPKNLLNTHRNSNLFWKETLISCYTGSNYIDIVHKTLDEKHILVFFNYQIKKKSPSF